MKDWLVEAFERKLLNIIEDNGVNGDGTVTIDAEDLLLIIRLYKHQITTIEQLDRRVESLQILNTNLESVITWHLRYEAAIRERDKNQEDYNELWKIYTQILSDGIAMKRKMNDLAAKNEVLLESVHYIANAQVDQFDTVIEYAGSVLEAFNKNG